MNCLKDQKGRQVGVLWILIEYAHLVYFRACESEASKTIAMSFG